MIRQREKRSGLTLLEVLLVMVIIIVLATAAYPTLSAMYGDIRVKAAADQVQGAWAECRARAIEDGRAYRFAVQPGTNRFRVAPDGPEFWDGSGGGQSDESTSPPYVQESELPKAILFTVSENLPAEGEWTTVAVFNPDGTCQADTEIALKEDGDTLEIVVRVRAMTGAVTVKKRSSGDQ
jgi:prepilin-type N-terminal cleavage/methylation domain-containing protein